MCPQELQEPELNTERLSGRKPLWKPKSACCLERGDPVAERRMGVEQTGERKHSAALGVDAVRRAFDPEMCRGRVRRIPKALRERSSRRILGPECLRVTPGRVFGDQECAKRFGKTRFEERNACRTLPGRSFRAARRAAQRTRQGDARDEAASIARATDPDRKADPSRVSKS